MANIATVKLGKKSRLARCTISVHVAMHVSDPHFHACSLCLVNPIKRLTREGLQSKLDYPKRLITVSRSTGSASSSLFGSTLSEPLRSVRSSHCGSIAMFFSVSRTSVLLNVRSSTAISCPIATCAEGMERRLPATHTCPCETSWHRRRRGGGK